MVIFRRSDAKLPEGNSQKNSKQPGQPGFATAARNPCVSAEHQVALSEAALETTCAPVEVPQPLPDSDALQLLVGG